MPRTLIICCFLMALASLRAGTIDVTSDSQVTLHPHQSLLFYLSSDYASHAPLESPYPGQIEVLFGCLPLDSPTAMIPGTSAPYIPGILFSGTLESLDGSIAIPLFDSNAARLGLPAGDMVLTTGYRNGGAYSGSISALTGSLVLSSQEAAELFSVKDFVIRLRDLQGEVTFGYPGSPLTTAFSASLSSADGTLSLGAMPQRVELRHNPEPGTIGLLLIGLAILTGRALRRYRA